MIKNRSLLIWPSVYPLWYTASPSANISKSIWKPSKRTSHIVDYFGNIMSYSASGYNTMAAAILDIEALRQFRVMNLNSNWMKDLRTEVFRKMYELPIHPKNLWLDQDPLPHEKVDEIYRANIRCLIERGSFTEPANRFRGAHYQSGASSPEEERWENIKTLWDGWGQDEQ